MELDPRSFNRPRTASARDILAVRLCSLGSELIAGASHLRATGDTLRAAALVRAQVERMKVYLDALDAYEAGECERAERILDLLAPFAKLVPRAT